MKAEEHKQIINSILATAQAEQQATASDLLTQLVDDYTEMLTNYEQATSRVDELTRNNEALREVNSKLFLRIGQTDKEETFKSQEQEEIPELKYEALFNEKGELI